MLSVGKAKGADLFKETTTVHRPGSVDFIGFLLKQ